MTEDVNEFEWRRHLLAALDNVSKRLDENSAEHTLIRAEVAAVKIDVAAVKTSNTDKKMDDYINAEGGWKMLAVGQVIAILAMVGSAVWWGGALSEKVVNIKDKQIQIASDVEDLKITSPEYRDFKLHTKIASVQSK